MIINPTQFPTISTISSGIGDTDYDTEMTDIITNLTCTEEDFCKGYYLFSIPWEFVPDIYKSSQYFSDPASFGVRPYTEPQNVGGFYMGWRRTSLPAALALLINSDYTIENNRIVLTPVTMLSYRPDLRFYNNFNIRKSANLFVNGRETTISAIRVDENGIVYRSYQTPNAATPTINNENFVAFLQGSISFDLTFSSWTNMYSGSSITDTLTLTLSKNDLENENQCKVIEQNGNTYYIGIVQYVIQSTRDNNMSGSVTDYTNHFTALVLHENNHKHLRVCQTGKLRSSDEVTWYEGYARILYDGSNYSGNGTKDFTNMSLPNIPNIIGTLDISVSKADFSSRANGYFWKNTYTWAYRQDSNTLRIFRFYSPSEVIKHMMLCTRFCTTTYDGASIAWNATQRIPKFDSNDTALNKWLIGSYYDYAADLRPWQDTYLKANNYTEQDIPEYNPISYDSVKKIDLDLNKKYYNSLMNEEVPHWNKSIQNLIDYYNKHFNKNYNYYENENGKIIDENGKLLNGADIFRLTDIKNSNAGANFSDEKEILDSVRKIVKPWVIPWYNIDGDTYRAVRGSDKDLDVLQDQENLQFTRSILKYKDGNDNRWMRLLMPQYTRFVEVEDLNRNFWVIGQTLSAISAFLFGPEAMIPSLLNNFLDEVCQLWENLLFLQSGIEASKQTPYYNKWHFEIVEVPNEEWQAYRKYDNFDNDQLSIHLDYLKKTYTDFNLCILPKIRMNNYEHNYYSKIFYPYFLILNRNTMQNYQEVPFDLNQNETDLTIGFFGIKFKMNLSEIDFTKLYGIKENDDSYDYGRLDICRTQENSGEFYSLISNIEEIEYDGIENKVHFKSHFIDKVAGILYIFNPEIGDFDLVFNLLTQEADGCQYMLAADTIEDTQMKSTGILNGFYQGDLISCPADNS